MPAARCSTGDALAGRVGRAAGERCTGREATAGRAVRALGLGTDLFDVAAGTAVSHWRMGGLDERFGQVLDVGLQYTLKEIGDARWGAVALGRQGGGQMVERGVAARGENDDSGTRVLSWGCAHGPPRFLAT